MKTINQKQLDEILPTVSRPGRYLGNEWNVIKKDLGGADVKFALAFPDVYDVGMSHLGFRIMYGVLNNRKDVACERVFAPWLDFEEKLKANSIPLFSLESKIPIKDFDIIGFSLTYELNYTNVLNMLNMAGIPLRSKDREAEFPLIIAGGPCAFNPYPMSEFIDAFVIGEGEEVILEIIDAYKRVTGNGLRVTGYGVRGTGYDKNELLKELSNMEGVYVPAFPKEIKKRIVRDLDKAFYPTRELVPYVQIIHDRITLEIMRGCPFSCKFCQATSQYKPVRFRSKKRIMELAGEIYRNTGYEEISLLSLSSGNYPGIASLVSDLIDEFKELGVGVSLPSLRSEDILQSLPSLIAKIKKTSLTFAVESGSERLRKYINKDIDVEMVIRACEEAFKAGWRLVKFYFMIGLPTETEEDLNGIVDFIYRVLKLRNDAQISVSISSFVPKTNTVFENEKMGDMETLLSKQRFLKGKIRNGRVKVKFHDVRLSFLEWQFNRRDKRLAEVVYEAWKKGAKFDAWGEFFNFNLWQDALKQLDKQTN